MSHVINLVYDELIYNHNTVLRLVEVLSKTGKVRQNKWNWASQVALSFEFDAYHHFKVIEIQEIERAIYSSLDLAYCELRHLIGRVREAHAEYDFLCEYSVDEGAANWQLDELTKNSDIVARYIKLATDSIRTKTKA